MTPETEKKVEVPEDGQGYEAVEVLKEKDPTGPAEPADPSEYPKVNVKMPPRYAIDFQPNVTAAEIALFLNTIGFALDNEAMVNRLSMSPGIKFKKIEMPPMGQMRPGMKVPPKRS